MEYLPAAALRYRAAMTTPIVSPSREQLLGNLYEAAELEHNLMCTYLYAAFSLRSGEGEGLTEAQSKAVARWRQTIIDVAIDAPTTTLLSCSNAARFK